MLDVPCSAPLHSEIILGLFFTSGGISGATGTGITAAASETDACATSAAPFTAPSIVGVAFALAAAFTSGIGFQSTITRVRACGRRRGPSTTGLP